VRLKFQSSKICSTRYLLALSLLVSVPVYSSKDSCFECHLVQKGPSPIFKDDVHYQHGISCSACHGGDPGQDRANAAMSDASGMKPRIMREQVPEFCGACHSDPAFMNKFKPGQRTDQVALYRRSVHGAALAEGNLKAAQCVDCHGVHNTRAVNDPGSPAHPSQIAAKCGACHQETARLFNQSPHARVFVINGMAGCSACHATHGVTRAGPDMLTGSDAVCFRCHQPDSATGRSVAAMAKTIAGLTGEKQRAAAREAAHGLKLAL